MTLNGLALGQRNAFAPELALYRAQHEGHRVSFAERIGAPVVVLDCMRADASRARAEYRCAIAVLLEMFEVVRVRIFHHHPHLPMGEPS